MGADEPAVVSDLQLKQIGDTAIIVPAEPTDDTPIRLSNIDQCLVIPVETIYFYNPCPTRPVEGMVDTFKDALSKVLVPYHFMAGRLRPTASGRLEINCNRAGVEVTHYTSALKVADLGDVVQPNPLYRQLVPHKFNATNVASAPLLAIQITIFACGGYTLGFMMSHTVFDGPGAIDFFLNFTSIARGEGLLFTPSYDRTQLMSRNPPIVKYDHPENLELPPDLPDIAQDQSPFTTADNAGKEFKPLENTTTHVTRTFPFTTENIETLKKRALEGGLIKRVSTFEVITAQIWLSRTKSVDLPEVPFNLLFAIDIRNKVKPPMPEHFAGNAVFSACARGTPSQIKAYTFPEAVQVIQKAIARVEDDYIRSSLDWGEVKKGVPALFGGFFLSAWWKMPFYSADYGWGQPIYAGPIVSPLVEFVYLLSNGKQDGGLNLVIALEHKQMAKFQKLILA